MIPLNKLERLTPGQQRRKTALLLASFERELLEYVNTGRSYPQARRDYLLSLLGFVAKDPKITLSMDVQICATATIPTLIRECNRYRHALLQVIGLLPAEWDLVHPSSLRQKEDIDRRFYPGIRAYVEDIRSPFNLGSIFRTAEAFGAELLYLSPLCCQDTHPRAVRSSMGSMNFLPFERTSLDNLPEGFPVFALETGGTPIAEFDFPSRGIVIVGSEELGMSPEGLERATYGRVSIPMTGIKASLNVGVAFGILMQAWTSYLDCSDIKPR